MAAPDGLRKVAASGDVGATLRTLRDVLAADIAACESNRDKAALVARFTDVLDRIAALPAEKKGTALDELARRRAAGDGVAARPVRAARR